MQQRLFLVLPCMRRVVQIQTSTTARQQYSKSHLDQVTINQSNNQSNLSTDKSLGEKTLRVDDYTAEPCISINLEIFVSQEFEEITSMLTTAPPLTSYMSFAS